MSLDLSDLTRPVTDQGDSRDCVPHAVAAAMRGWLMRHEPPADSGIAELDIEEFVAAVAGVEDIRECLRHVAANGVRAKRCFHAEPCDQEHRYGVRFRRKVGGGRIRSAVGQDGPAIVPIQLYSDFRDHTGPAPYEPQGTPENASHAVCLVGWDDPDDDDVGRWILMNSYGREWGNEGFFTVWYNDGKLRIENGAFVVIGVPELEP